MFNRPYLVKLKILYYRIFHMLTFQFFKFMDLKHLSFFPKIKNKVILDLGCGYGDFSGFFSKYCKEVYAIDIDPFNIRNTYLAGNRKKNIFYSVADATNLPFKNSTFDFVWCNQVIEHIKNDTKVFKEVHRVLKENGLAYFTTPYAPLRKQFAPHNSWLGRTFDEHVRDGYSKADVKKKTKGLFKIIEISNKDTEYDIKYQKFQEKFPRVVRVILYPLFLIIGYKFSQMGKKTTGSCIRFLLRKID